MRSFFEYIKNPIPLEKSERFSFNIFLKTIGLSYLLFFISSVFLVVFKYLNLVPQFQKPEVNSLTIFLLITVLGPFCEEILFRLGLKISKLNIAAFIAVFFMLIIKLFFIQCVGLQFYLYLGSIFLFYIINYALIDYNLPINNIGTFCNSKFKYIFHLSAISFGLLHLTNFETIYWWMVVISPLLTAPYIALGLILGYIRMKYGFSYGWLIHSTFNFIFAMFAVHKGIIVVLILAIVLPTYNYIVQKGKKS